MCFRVFETLANIHTIKHVRVVRTTIIAVAVARGEREKMRTMTAVEAVEENPVRDAQNETHPFGHLMLWICSSCASSLQLKMQTC